MKESDDGAQLHDKATRGEPLAAVEQERLDAWYAEQDAAEAALLQQPASSQVADDLRAEIASALVRLQEAARHVQDLSTANAALRDELTVLQKRLAQRLSSRMM
ncbi:MAG: hypothetical protein ACTHNK_13335 [Thermomicrobiales bacterium]